MAIFKTNIKLLIILFILLGLSFQPNFVYAAASSGDSSSGASDKVNLYKAGKKLVLRAKKLEKKDKIEKANKRYEKAFEYLIKSNKEIPNQPDTLNYLGYTSRKLGNFEIAEKYYLEGLKIKPDHNGINEYLGELYIKTNRIDLAKQRLEVLKVCNCEEYDELKELIDNN